MAQPSLKHARKQHTHQSQQAPAARQARLQNIEPYYRSLVDPFQDPFKGNPNSIGQKVPKPPPRVAVFSSQALLPKDDVPRTKAGLGALRTLGTGASSPLGMEVEAHSEQIKLGCVCDPFSGVRVRPHGAECCARSLASLGSEPSR